MTYGELFENLKSLNERQLKQKIQVALPESDGEKVLALHDVISLDTIESLEMERTRSSYDNKHHPEDYVLLVDWNWFAEDGSVAADLATGERVFPHEHQTESDEHDS